jgi:hypothetical protein
MALATLGGVGIAMGAILSADPERDDEQPDGPACFGCHRSGRATKLLTFALEFRRPGRGGRGRKVGSIRLCEKCWKDCR